jgi:hypothetical protein
VGTVLKAITITFAVCVGATIGAFEYQYGAVTPCGIVRSMARTEAAKEGGLAVLVAAMPDSVINGLLEATVGPLTQGKCLSLAFSGLPGAQTHPKPVQVAAPPVRPIQPPPPPGPRYAPVAPPADWASREASAAALECRSRRLSGELKSYVASAQCSNQRILRAYQTVHYRYMDLIYQWVAKRTELAERQDKDLLTDAQANLEGAQFFSDLRDTEMRRDRGQ